MSEPAHALHETLLPEEYYRTLWNHAVDAKVIVDAQGVIRDVNGRAEFKLGYTRAELTGMPVLHVVWDHDRARFRKLLTQVLTGGKERSTAGLHVPTRCGTVLTMDVEMIPVERTERADGTMVVLLQFDDTTEKRHVEQQRIRSERLASLSQFASLLAHDIRHPLTGIKKTLELLGARPELQAQPIAHWFGDVQLRTDLLLGMIDDRLDVYQESCSGLPIVVSHFPVEVLFEEAVHLIKGEADAKDVTVRLDVCPEQIMMTGDRCRLQRVGVNLLQNAVQCSPPMSVITVSIKVRYEGAMPAGLGKTGDEVLLMRVEDEGPGIDADEFPSLFDMFVQKKDGDEGRIGRGLGLHFCRLVIEAHHGRIWAANRSSGGAQFSIAVPLRARE
ncbi:MAG TPA: PAS domain-containing sensor histidine kinase [Nitrospiraceae bacterium]|nr:PAS domain-containing sensor histidine kinase [Nitrospiraceae bacterium]